MRIRIFYLSMVITIIALALCAGGCAKKLSVSNPLGNVTLVPPYPADYPGAPSDKISVQYAVMAVARQTGVAYDFDASFKNTDPVCRQWITPVIQRQPFPQALDMILRPVNLTYTISNGRITLGRWF